MFFNYFILEEILESFSSHPPFLFPTSDYLLDLEAEAPHPVVKKTLDNLKSSFGSSQDPQLSSSSTLRNPQVLIQGPDSDLSSRRSTPANSVKSSPPVSVTASPRKLAQTFSSSDPTLNNVDPNRLSNRLKNQGKIRVSPRYVQLFIAVNTGSMRDGPYLTSRKNSLELIELSSINEVKLV